MSVTLSPVSLITLFQFHIYRRIKIADFDFNEKCRQIAANTEGLSGREIAKLGVAWQVRTILLYLFCLLVYRGVMR